MRVLCCCAQLFSPVWLFQTPWTVACQAPPSMGFPRQESWSGLPSPSPGDLPDPGTEPMAPASPAASALPADSLSLSHWGNLKNLQFSSVQSLSHALLFATPWTAASQASLFITNSLSLLKFMSIELVMLSNYLIPCCPFLPFVFNLSQHQSLFQ